MTETTLPIPNKISRYEILRELGRGGMAAVYLAHDPNFGREVAVKVLPRELMHDPAFRARFHREARTIAALEHPAIVPVYDFGEEDGQPFLVMRYMSGGSLVARIRAGPVPPSEAAKILVRIGAALDAAHAKGVVHRDLKPANILFDQYGEAYLGDFGIAQLSAPGTTLTGSMILGTPAYMSPEQIQGGKKLDGRSDIYALGIVMFEMLTGKAPFEADSPLQLMMMHISTPPPRIPETAIQLPPGSNAVLERALAKEPEHRYQKAADFGRAFQELTAGKRISSPSSLTGDFEASPGTPILPPEGMLPPARNEAAFAVTGRTENGINRTRRLAPWVVSAAAVACLCLAIGGGGTLFAVSEGGRSLLGLAARPSPTATETATLSPSLTPSPSLSPAAETAAAAPTTLPLKAGEPFLLTDGKEVSTQPEIAVDSKGIVHVFWLDRTDPMNAKIFHRALSGASWTDPVCVTCLAGDPKYLSDYQIAARNDGKVCVGFSWSPQLSYVVTVACFEGAAPGELQTIPAPGGVFQFLLHQDPSGNLITLFRDTKSIRVGDQKLTDGSLILYSPAFAIDSQNGYHLAWIRDSEPPVLIHRYSADQGKTWSGARVLIAGGVGIADEVRLFAAGNGEVYLLTGGLTTRTMRWNGNWSEAAALPEDLISSNYSFIEDPGGQVSLLSLGYQSGKDGIWILRSEGSAGGWAQPFLLFKLENRIELGLSAAIGPDGAVYLAYAQSKENYLSGDIHFLETSLPW
jgi:hypothetical protein